MGIDGGGGRRGRRGQRERCMRKTLHARQQSFEGARRHGEYGNGGRRYWRGRRVGTDELHMERGRGGGGYRGWAEKVSAGGGGGDAEAYYSQNGSGGIQERRQQQLE